MYEEFFGLQEAPFSLTPDPRYLWLSETHEEGLATLVELQESESASTRARARTVAALRDLLVARAGLELAVG